MMFARHSFVLVAIFVGGLLLPAYGNAPVEPIRVDFSFDRLGRENWVRATVEVRSNGNPTAESSRARSFASNVRVVLNLAYQGEGDGDFHFYVAEATAVALERGRTHQFVFYLPYDLLNRRDGIRREPFGHLVEIFVEGEEMPITRNSVGRQPTPESLQSFRDRVARESMNTQGIFVPIYLSPFWTQQTAAVSPAFIRREN